MSTTTEAPRAGAIDLPGRAEHGTRRGYDLGCRCFPCRLAQSRYQREWAANGPTRVPAEQVRAHIDRLVASGWTKQQIQWEAGVSSSQVWYVENKAKGVNRDVAERLLAVEPLTERRLDPEVLRPWLERAARESRTGGLKGLLEDTGIIDPRQWYRILERGWIGEGQADELAVRLCGLTLEEVYGWELEEVAS